MILWCFSVWRDVVLIFWVFVWKSTWTSKTPKPFKTSLGALGHWQLYLFELFILFFAASDVVVCSGRNSDDVNGFAEQMSQVKANLHVGILLDLHRGDRRVNFRRERNLHLVFCSIAVTSKPKPKKTNVGALLCNCDVTAKDWDLGIRSQRTYPTRVSFDNRERYAFTESDCVFGHLHEENSKVQCDGREEKVRHTDWLYATFHFTYLISEIYLAS